MSSTPSRHDDLNRACPANRDHECGPCQCRKFKLIDAPAVNCMINEHVDGSRTINIEFYDNVDVEPGDEFALRGSSSSINRELSGKVFVACVIERNSSDRLWMHALNKTNITAEETGESVRDRLDRELKEPEVSFARSAAFSKMIASRR